MSVPEVDYQAPASLVELLALKAEKGPAAAVLAGGTDLVVRLKQRLAQPEVLLSLKNIAELKTIEVDPVQIVIGAGVTLAEIIKDETVAAELPGLAEALSRVGHPSCQHHTATLAGNLLLEPRCLYYNQSDFWRKGLERCFKAGGQVCLIMPESKECSSANLSDGAPMVVALSGQVRLVSARGERIIPAAELYTGKGEEPFTLQPDEVLAEIRIPRPVGLVGQAYEKICYRSFLDFPLVSAAALIGLNKGLVDRVRLVVGGASAAPLTIDEAEAVLKGEEPTEALIRKVSAAAMETAAGLIVNNAGANEEYRRQMVEVAARRALLRALERAR